MFPEAAATRLCDAHSHAAADDHVLAVDADLASRA
jgi:hypothetical protein